MLKNILSKFGSFHLDTVHYKVINILLIVALISAGSFGFYISSKIGPSAHDINYLEQHKKIFSELEAIDTKVEANKDLNLEIDRKYQGLSDKYTLDKLKEITLLNVGDPIVINGVKYQIQKHEIEVTFKYSETPGVYDRVSATKIPIGSMLKLNGEVLFKEQRLFFNSFLKVDTSTNSNKSSVVLLTDDKDFSLTWGSRMVESIVLVPLGN